MTQSLENLTRQIGSVESIHGIVRTMKTLSVINAVPYEQAVEAIDAYRQTVISGLHAFTQASDHAELAESASRGKVIVVFGSDHGLCGNYNDVLAARVADHFEPDDIETPTVLCVGAQMADALAGRYIPVQEVFLPPASVDGIGRLANLLTLNIDTLRRDVGSAAIAVDLAFNARGDNGSRVAKLDRMMPLSAKLLHALQETPWQSRTRPAYTMPAPELFRNLIRQYLFASLFRASAEALVTENAARLALMSQAEQSVEERLESLRSDANALRQSGITTELLDVVIGFEALKKKASRR